MNALVLGTARSLPDKAKRTLTTESRTLRSQSLLHRSQTALNGQVKRTKTGELFGRATTRPSIEVRNRTTLPGPDPPCLAGQPPGPPLKYVHPPDLRVGAGQFGRATTRPSIEVW